MAGQPPRNVRYVCQWDDARQGVRPSTGGNRANGPESGRGASEYEARTMQRDARIKQKA
jgi:hypothetical protein